MAKPEDLQETIRRFREELRQAETEAQAALRRRDHWRHVVSSLVALAEGEATERPPNLFEITAAPFPRPDPVVVVGANGEVPRGREAVRLVLIDTRRAWKIPELAEEIKRRGWMPGVVSHRDAVAATVQRLVKDGVAERVGHGVYRYRLDKLPPKQDSG